MHLGAIDAGRTGSPFARHVARGGPEVPESLPAPPPVRWGAAVPHRTADPCYTEH
ncbi:hypothetical protein APS67_004373 [Streptomyces sp. AVP053U2]|nr:hypothetical protein APS67_004373 [Streptomyces sp. AVP053U2]